MSRVVTRPEASAGLLRALWLSLLAAAVPVSGVFFFPDSLKDYEALTWLLLLVPAFLWAYERGWRGVATALALGMAVLSTTYAVAEVLGRAVPDLLLAVVVIYVATTLGIGLFGARLSQAEFTAAAETLALQDPLTGMPNRRHAELHLEMEFAAAERGRALAVVLFDLDRLEEYNTHNGRAAGDGVLRGFATLLRQQTRRMDLSARYGSDEFAAVLTGCPEEGAVIFAARLQERLRAAEHTVALPTISAGIACYHPQMKSSDELLRAAEQALAQAQADGGDRVRIHGRGLLEPREPDSSVLQAAGEAGERAAASGEAPRGNGVLVRPAGPLGQGRSAFVMVDDAFVRDRLVGLLRRHGLHVTEGRGLADTVVPLQRSFDLMYVDLAPRDWPAGDLIREVRFRSPATRVLGVLPTAGGAVAPEILQIRVDGHYLPQMEEPAFLLQIGELLTERDALTNAQLRTHQLSNEMRAKDRQARQALAESEARFHAVAQTIQEVIFSTDAAGNWTFLNPAWTAITGFTAEESLGKPLFAFVPPEDERALRQEFRHALAVRVPYYRRECRWRTRGGIDRWAELRLQVTLAPSGAVEGTSGVIADVTERRRAEEALRRSEQYFRSLIESSADMIAVLNADASIRYLSPTVERVVGAVPTSCIGRTVLERVHPDDLPGATECLARLLEEPGTTCTLELRVRDAAGDWQDVEATARNLLLEQGVEGVVINARDITERRHAQKALRESEQMLLRAQKMDAIGRLAGGVAHDFNNLLTAIQGHAELLLTDLGDDAAVRTDVVEIRDAAARATSLTRQLLAFSSRQVLQPRMLDLNASVSGMEAMLRRLIGEHVLLVHELAPQLRAVSADPVQIEQVLLNLILNARDAMPDGGTVRVSTGERDLDEADTLAAELPAGRYVVLTVSDNGTGMEPAVLTQAFDPFFTTKATGEGTGLGLSTVWGIVKQSGGHVVLESTPGAGTTATVLLPAVAAAAGVATEVAAAAASGTAAAGAATAASVTAAQRAAARPPGGEELILLVEDEKSVRELAARILTRQGYHVLTAEHGRAALELLAEVTGRVDLLLTDVVMPELNGQDLAEEVRRRTPDTRVLFMSGYNEAAVLRDGVLVPGTAFIEKPFSPAALLAQVRTILDAAPTGPDPATPPATPPATSPATPPAPAE
jgi:diguanylate cyclase (GGDEF)-like protein/PAS domain S-box-containing protein